LFPRIHYVSWFWPLGSPCARLTFSSKRFRRQLKLAAGVAFSHRHFRGRFSIEEPAVPLCETRLPSTVALHPVYVSESVVGSRNCLAAVRDSSCIVGNRK
jgi:hypothetical protein